jgi:His-Xaa-Ser system radical SAM maturase HxsC
MRLHTTGVASGFQEAIIARVVTEPVPAELRKHTVLVAASAAITYDTDGYAAIVFQERVDTLANSVPLVHSIKHIDHLKSGHIVVLEPLNGVVRTLFRPETLHNILFATERCNSNCLMCSQPPIDKDDIEGLTKRNLKLIDLIPSSAEYLCITGGEPTLLGSNLLAILEKLGKKLPSTHVHILTNGRRFAWPEFTASFAAISHPDLTLGIPLYADYAPLHDYIVQAKDGFDQTVLGLHQLARHGVAIEIRVVLHALTAPRLERLAEYISRNLTFVEHVAFMGMEHIGYAPRNLKELWIDPVDYQDALERSIATLSRFGIESRIYNLQLCVLKKSLWKYSKQAISDWKNEYKDVCNCCAVRNRCGGFFQWSTSVQSRGIHAIAAL